MTNAESTPSPADASPADASHADPQGHAPAERHFCARCSLESGGERMARHSSVLKRLVEIGMSAAEALECKAVAEAEAAEALAARLKAGESMPTPMGARPGPDIALAFSRLARSIQTSLLLEDTLVDNFQKREKSLAAEAAERKSQATEARRKRTRRQVERVVTEAIRAEAGDRGEYDHLIRRLKVKIDQNDVYDDLATKSVEEMVVRLCRDLELSPDWQQWEGQAWLRTEEPAIDDTAPHCPACCPRCRSASPPSEPQPAASGSTDPP
jgi:hypothetical protein